jgi:hypothetical protein
VTSEKQEPGAVPAILSRVGLDAALSYIPDLPDEVRGWVENSNLVLVRYNALAAQVTEYFAHPPANPNPQMMRMPSDLRTLAGEAENTFLHARNALSKLIEGRPAG